MNPSSYNRYEFEVVGKDSPLTINLGNLGKVVGVELEHFDYIPSSTPSYGLMGITVNGIKGRYNKYGNSINCLQSIAYIGNRFHYDDMANSEVIQTQTQDSQLIVGFIVRTSDDTSSLNRTNIVFDNNYLLNFSVLVQK